MKLSEVDRQIFAALADVLIPAAEGMPSASQVGIHGAPLDAVLRFRPELGADLQRGLQAAGGADPRRAVEALNREDPAALGAIGLAASAAYYMHPKVHQLLGYPGQVSRPVTPEEENDYARGDILRPVIERGSIYRLAPD